MMNLVRITPDSLEEEGLLLHVFIPHQKQRLRSSPYFKPDSLICPFKQKTGFILCCVSPSVDPRFQNRPRSKPRVLSLGFINNRIFGFTSHCFCQLVDFAGSTLNG